MGAHEWIWIVRVLAWAFLFVNAFRFRLVGRYKLVFALILVSVFFEAINPWTASALGRDSVSYAVAYLARGLLTAALTAAVLLQIYGLPKKVSLREDWHLIAIPVLLLGLVFSDPKPVWIFARILSGAGLVVTYLGLAAIMRTARSKTLNLGWNYKMVLLALTVPAVFESIVFTAYAIGLPLTYESVRLWLKGASLASWIIFAVGMVEYSPPALRPATRHFPLPAAAEEEAEHVSESRENLCITP